MLAGGIFTGGGKGGGNVAVDVVGWPLFCELVGAGLVATFEAPVLAQGRKTMILTSEGRSGCMDAVFYCNTRVLTLVARWYGVLCCDCERCTYSPFLLKSAHLN